MRDPVTRYRLSPARSRAAAFGLLCALALACGREAEAAWSRPEEIVIGTAYTLDQGAFSIGVFEPLRYGALDSVMLTTRPVLHLLLTPNINVRARIVAEPLCLSFQVGYMQSFLEERESGFPGAVHGKFLLSVPLFRRVVLTGSLGYAFGFFPSDHQIPMAFAIHGLFSRSSMVMAQLAAIHSVSRGGLRQPNVQLLYAHGWSSFHLGFGVSIGRYEFMPWTGLSVAVQGVAIAPVIDAWWRF